MNALLISGALVYLLKVTAVSGLSYGYYRLFLRNRAFHQYNRYYLLGATLVSLVLPLIRLPAIHQLPAIAQSSTLAGALHAISPGDFSEGTSTPGHSVTSIVLMDWRWMFLAAYSLAAGVFLYVFIRQLLYIRQLPHKYVREQLGRIDFFMTREPGTPFSFLNQLFWNEEIDPDSHKGRQVFRHEWYHIHQRHTLDLLLLKSVMILCWVNPFFYLIYREIRTIHEFLADRHAVSGGDRYEYAELLVWQNIYDRPLPLLHPFFQSSIKRRITMLTRLTSARPRCISRAMALPLALLLLCAFSGRLDPARQLDPAHPLPSSPLPAFTVVIDAGHGGMDDGAVAGNTKEKDINLALALKIQQLSPEYHVTVLLTRQTDELAGKKSSIHESLEYRAALANERKADLFVSIHVNSRGAGAATTKQGFSAWVSTDNVRYPQCVQLGSAMLEAFRGTYATDESIHQVPDRIYVLRNSNMPAVLLECGFLDNPDDRTFICDSLNQEKVARDILQGIQRYEEGQAAGR
jgi:N-acetylmuramoyl-L-alanine amidase